MEGMDLDNKNSEITPIKGYVFRFLADMFSEELFRDEGFSTLWDGAIQKLADHPDMNSWK
jgi:hypothetical protein